MRRYWLVCFLLCFLSCQSGKELKHITVVSYNVENLFDTEDDPHINDNEFLPGSDKQWTSERYKKKLNDIARVLRDVNPEDMPEIIGLMEIENRKVLDDLIKTEALAPGNYRIVHQNSPDERGIDVALLYRPEEFSIASFAVIPMIPGAKSRDILYVKGRFDTEDFHFFINHWPSRIKGQKKSEPKRLVAAKTLRQKVDSIWSEAPKANIVILGDMNDEPQNISLHTILGADSPDSNSSLVNLMMPLALKKKGTYNYRGTWNMLDNLVVSSTLLDATGFQIGPPYGFVFRKPWMEYTNNRGDVSPNRTYGGSKYYGGVSDHFPVYFEMNKP